MSALDHALERAQTTDDAQPWEGEAVETSPTTAVAVRSLHARAREAAKPPAGNSNTPLGDELRRWLHTNPVRALQVYEEALSAERTIVVRGELIREPDHGTRLKALDSIANRAEGMPTSRTELTGAEGGPVVLAALLASDPADLI